MVDASAGVPEGRDPSRPSHAQALRQGGQVGLDLPKQFAIASREQNACAVMHEGLGKGASEPLVCPLIIAERPARVIWFPPGW
jgi:hypothetical protein